MHVCLICSTHTDNGCVGYMYCFVVYNYGDYSHHFGVEVLCPLPPLGGVVFTVCVFF